MDASISTWSFLLTPAAYAMGFFLGSSHTSDLKIGTPVATPARPGVIGSVLGLVFLVSVYCDWVG